MLVINNFRLCEEPDIALDHLEEFSIIDQTPVYKSTINLNLFVIVFDVDFKIYKVIEYVGTEQLTKNDIEINIRFYKSLLNRNYS
jgi:hypothetical protein